MNLKSKLFEAEMSLRHQLISSACIVNQHADGKDVMRNFTNYGELTGIATVLRKLFGAKINIAVSDDDNGFLRVHRITYDDASIDF